jgi:hypothetical protein
MKSDEKQVGYHFDLIRINSSQFVNVLKRNLPISDLKKECRSFRILEAFPQAAKYGFRSRLEIVAPTQSFFITLLKYESELNCHYKHLTKVYKISYLEVARDTYYETASEADEAANSLRENLRKKWSTRTMECDVLFEDKYRERNKRGKGYFGRYTRYYGGDKNFNFTVYQRISKINGKPCAHEEWRFIGASQIKMKSKISSIADLINFDFQAFCRQQDSKYLAHESINIEKLGKWLCGWTRRRKFTADEKRKIIMQAGHFLRHRKIKTPADLVNYFSKRKAEFRSKKGRKTKREMAYLKLNPSRFLERA